MTLPVNREGPQPSEADIINAVCEVGHGMKFSDCLPFTQGQAVAIARDAFRRAGLPEGQQAGGTSLCPEVKADAGQSAPASPVASGTSLIRALRALLEKWDGRAFHAQAPMESAFLECIRDLKSVLEGQQAGGEDALQRETASSSTGQSAEANHAPVQHHASPVASALSLQWRCAYGHRFKGTATTRCPVCGTNNLEQGP